MLRQVKELLTQGVCRLVLGAYAIIVTQATQHGEKPLRIFQVLTELSGGRVRLSRFRSCVAFRGSQQGTQGNQDVDFALGALGCFW